jgi:hypothetical protein
MVRRTLAFVGLALLVVLVLLVAAAVWPASTMPQRPVLEHDIVDPHQPWARPAFVYPKLLAFAEAPQT